MPSGTTSLSSVVARLIVQLDEGGLEPGFSTPVRRGSAEGTVSVQRSPVHRTHLLVVTLDIMRSPGTDRAAFLSRLLDLNATLLGRAAFSLDGEGIVRLQAGRPIEDMQAGELIDLIVWTADQADRLDDILLDEFGRENEL